MKKFNTLMHNTKKYSLNRRSICNMKKFVYKNSFIYLNIDKNVSFDNGIFSISCNSGLLSTFRSKGKSNNLSTYNCIFVPVISDAKIKRWIGMKLDIKNETVLENILFDCEVESVTFNSYYSQKIFNYDDIKLVINFKTLEVNTSKLV
ncbi:hypothetical protein BNATCHR298 (nucleomorph) [Bigelowiella natans]|uniref:Uncharacterized protein n=1 Tax=Bigelowiella natans TaxID=227086 RepID=Q3LW69_BIGNA|nr:hypothetical protein BNATCHR298 [Bigelowiella natans]ABA27297.1 hypothetical protein [Bigelowiella natans]|mmetsp:Transcript_5839/g.7085  ORF Transcript_5839/g.7085 Transcript_5839/m.7085 type:complete len:148 (-) Transcript_5839:1645-2088(-)